jgi:16S rRNA (uracil1498-N3)-methyltransferase
VKVAESALKQSQQAFMPKINEIREYKEFIKTNTSDVKLIAHCEKESKQHIKQFIAPNKSYTILIGPEGDFNTQEIKDALALHYTPTSLGNSRLRTETAGVFACNAFAVLLD